MNTDKPKAEIGNPRCLSTVDAPGLTVSLFEMATGGYFIHANFATGCNYYSPIFRDEFIASSHAAQMAHNAHMAEEHRCCEQANGTLTRRSQSDEAQTVTWKCPNCEDTNTDTRRSFVICTNCGTTYTQAPAA